MEAIINQLNQYKRKYYFNLLIKGVLISTAILLTAYLFFNTLEFYGRFGTSIRSVFFFTFIGLLLYTAIYWIGRPLLKILNITSQISNEKAAKQIGEFFPDIKDQLVNTLQLQKMDSSSNELLKASIAQKTKKLSIFHFPDAVKIDNNKKYLRYILPPFLILLLLLVFSRGFITKSSARILNYKQTYVPKAPFTFDLQNQKLAAFRNEDFIIKLEVNGTAVPEEVYLHTGRARVKMKKEKDHFVYTLKKIQKEQYFSFDAAGFDSKQYHIQLKERPNLLNFITYIQYPGYLNKPKEAIKNVGNLTVPQGSTVQWEFNTLHTKSVKVYLKEQDKWIKAQKDEDKYKYSLALHKSMRYQVHLKNQYSNNQKPIEYSISVIPDQKPSISIETVKDTTLYSYLMVGGNVGDDYGLSQLKLFYKITSKKRNTGYRAINLPLKAGQNIQKYFYQLNLNSLKLQEGEKIEYFTQVWDNDGVNGHKSAKSATFRFAVPSHQQMKEAIKETVQKTEQKIDQSLQNAKNLKEQLKAFENKIKTKKNLDFNDKKQLKQLLEKKKEIENNLQQLQELNQTYNEKQERFDPNKTETQEKIKELQKLMDELLDEKTKKLYDELEKLMKEDSSEKEMLDVLEKINNKEENFEKDLERTLEMFKQMQVEQKMEKINEDLKKLSEEQEKLAEQTKKADKNNPKENQALQKKQEALNKKFEQLKKENKELKKENKELEFPNKMPEEQKEEEISQDQKKAKEQLEKKDHKKAEKSQKDAAKKMKEMQKEMESAMKDNEEEKAQENMDDLRAILENLVTLSFDQEKVMNDISGVSLLDPSFIKLSQQQLKLQDDAKIIEDSLTTLSKRVVQMKSFITREVGDMKLHMTNASKFIKERKKSKIKTHQQYAMTSMNNIALMLSNILKKMQDQQKKGGKGKAGKGKKGGKSPSLSKLQQKLNQQIQELKKNGKPGSKGLSEKLAKMAAQQEQIRKMLEEMSKKGKLGKNGGGDQVKEMLKNMEKTEEDLVNKRLTQKLINRQKSIQTKLLQSEKAKRERDLDDKRKGKTARPKQIKIPPSLQKYHRTKESQKEIIKKVPPTLSPYYKKEVDKYFKKIN